LQVSTGKETSGIEIEEKGEEETKKKKTKKRKRVGNKTTKRDS